MGIPGGPWVSPRVPWGSPGVPCPGERQRLLGLILAVPRGAAVCRTRQPCVTQPGSARAGFQPQTKIPERDRRSPAIRPEFLSPQPPPGSAQLLPPRSLVLHSCCPPAPDFCPSLEFLHLWFRLALLGKPQRCPGAGLGQEGRGCATSGILGSPGAAQEGAVLVLGDVPTSIPTAGWTRGGARGASPRPQTRAGPTPAWAAATSSLQTLPKSPVPSKPFPLSWSWPRRGLALRFWSCQHKKRAGRAAAARPPPCEAEKPEPLSSSRGAQRLCGCTGALAGETPSLGGHFTSL